MRDFKFLQPTKKERVFSDWMDAFDDYHLGGIQPPSRTHVDVGNVRFNFNPDLGNVYLGFNMDIVMINVIRYINLHRQNIINNDIDLFRVNVPINNCWMRILDWRSLPSRNPPRIEISYRIFEANTTPTNFTASIETEEFLRLVQTP